MQLNFPKGGVYKLMFSRSSFLQYKTVTVFVGLKRWPPLWHSYYHPLFALLWNISFCGYRAFADARCANGRRDIHDLILHTNLYCMRYRMYTSELHRQLSSVDLNGLIWYPSQSVLHYDRRSVGQSLLVSSPHLGLMTRSLLPSDNWRFVDIRRPPWREDGSFTMYNVQYILLSQIWDHVPVLISPRNRVTWLYPQALGPCWYPSRCIFLLYNLGSDLMENMYCRFYLATDCISKNSISVYMCLLSRCLAADGF
jgi:hypothetical protein